jgi:hypothetical protein
MICKKCIFWSKRELPKQRKKYYPAGRCSSLRFNKNGQRIFTTENTNCDCGELK